MIYVIGPASTPRRVKIGYTRHPVKRRLKQLQSGHPEPLTVVGVMHGEPADERRLHEKYGAFRLSGEWFDLSDEAFTELKRHLRRPEEVATTPHAQAPKTKTADGMFGYTREEMLRSNTASYWSAMVTVFGRDAAWLSLVDKVRADIPHWYNGFAERLMSELSIATRHFGDLNLNVMGLPTDEDTKAHINEATEGLHYVAEQLVLGVFGEVWKILAYYADLRKQKPTDPHP